MADNDLQSIETLSPTFRQCLPSNNLNYIYSMGENFFRKQLEHRLANLEYGKYALTFPSGMAALHAVTKLLRSGDHVICFDDTYGGTSTYFRHCVSNYGIELTFSDLRDPSIFHNDIKENTRLVWFETPTNPTLKIVDIEAISNISKEHPRIILAVDNTFMTPYFQNPLKLGANIVMHSLTKYIGGHSDVLMGAVITNDDNLYNELKYNQDATGAFPSPFECYLVLRSIKTLHIRMEKHMANATAVAKFLEGHPAVESVIYPGLKSHPQYEIVKKQCHGFSGMVSFYFKGGFSQLHTFVTSIKLITLAGSLGSYESTVQVPVITSHRTVPEEQRLRMNITDNLIRFSVGLESEEDLLKDLDQALNKCLESM